MTTLFTPLEAWDMNDCIRFCTDTIEANMANMSLEEFVDQFEQFNNESIVTLIDWSKILGHDIHWNKISSCSLKPSKVDMSGYPYTVREDEEDIDFWAVEIAYDNGSCLDILHTNNADEANVITNSINEFYVDSRVNKS